MQDSMNRPVVTDAIAAATRIADDAWSEAQRAPYIHPRLGIRLAHIPEISEAEVERRAGVGRTLLKRLDATDRDALPHDLALTLRLVEFRARTWAMEGEWYWTVVDPLGVGFFGMFLPTAYCGGILLNVLHGQLGSFRIAEQADCEWYLALAAGYGRLIGQFTERTLGQAKRGINMPKAQLAQARALLPRLRAACLKSLVVDRERLSGIDAGRFEDDLQACIEQKILPAFDRAISSLSDAYEARAPASVGLGQYPAGREIYEQLVRLHTTFDLTPEQVHAAGHERMARIEREMSGIRSEIGFRGDGASFLKQVNDDPRWRAGTVEGVTAVFQRYIDRLKPHLGRYFATLPEAGYGIAPLPAALQDGMTFGYYDAPRSDRQHGQYLFNASNLTRQALLNVGALTYHELMPGHHLHLATQAENSRLHPFRQFGYVNSYTEGWAEYAATFAGEIGLYEEPEERYGRLIMDAFLTCRLVVDTGMNVMGWSLEEGRDYMRSHSGMAEAEILTESIRYSCDLPGQSLAYKLGDTHIFRLRDRMREVLGSRFDLKTFHEVILGPGALPMGDLTWHVEGEIERLSRHRPA